MAAKQVKTRRNSKWSNATAPLWQDNKPKLRTVQFGAVAADGSFRTAGTFK